MADVIIASKSFNSAIFEYCKASKLKLEEFMGKIPVDGKYSEIYDCAVRASVTNLLSGNREEYVFTAKKAKLQGYMLNGAYKIK